jgi:hypothetical protein
MTVTSDRAIIESFLQKSERQKGVILVRRIDLHRIGHQVEGVINQLQDLNDQTFVIAIFL